MGRGPDKLRRHLGGVFGHLHGMTVASHRKRKPRERAVLIIAGLLVAGAAAAVTLGWSTRPGPVGAPSAALLDSFLPRSIDLTVPARPEPRRFPARSTMPDCREEDASGGLRGHFHVRHDLVRVDDPRVWWESDNDTNDTEDDHLMHRAMEEPFRRLVELVVAAGGTLKVQDIYRDAGIHAPKSLHKEGRAVDLTCDELGLERLAQLAWAAGFDWVFHEWPKKGGAHVHASVRADRPRLAPGTPVRN
jgi:hypothetical protein